MAVLNHGVAQLSGARLHYVHAGEGPLVVLLHGFPEAWFSWEPQLHYLADQGFHVVAPDLRGYGGSSKPTRVSDCHVDHLAKDVAELVNHLGQTRAHIVGHDWGAMVAWWVANEHPEVVDKLVICNVPHPRRMIRAVLTSPKQTRKSHYIFFFQLPILPERALLARGAHSIRRIFEREPARPEQWPEGSPERYAKAFATPGTARAAVNYYRSAFRNVVQIWRRCKVIDADTLVLWGVGDPHLGAELAAPPPDLVPKARLQWLEGASHWVQHDARDEINAALLAHFRPG